MEQPPVGHAALYVKCPDCQQWQMHVAGTEGLIVDMLTHPGFRGWSCDCGADYPATMHSDANPEQRTRYAAPPEGQG